MKRDLNLIRELMFAIEDKSETAHMASEDFKLEGYTTTQIGLHLNMMAEAGLLVCEPSRSTTNPDRFIRVLVFELSWKGHEYLDTIRDPKIWTAAKSKVDKIGGASFEIVVELAKGIAKSYLAKIGVQID